MREKAFRARYKATGELIPNFQAGARLDDINDSAYLVDEYSNILAEGDEKIFEKDIVEDHTKLGRYVVFLKDGCFQFKNTENEKDIKLFKDFSKAQLPLKVIGNLYLNSRLLFFHV